MVVQQERKIGYLLNRFHRSRVRNQEPGPLYPENRKMPRLISTLSFLIVICTGYGQNLVPNPSFEEVNKVEKKWCGTDGEFNRNMKYWDSPTQGSPDILFLDYLGQMFPPRELVDLSAHTPRTGKMMIGIKTYGCPSRFSPCKEYLQVKLKKSLRTGQKYYFEYWVCPIQPSVKVNSFGIALARNRTSATMELGTLDLQPMSINKEIISCDSTLWHRISGVFEPDDTYAYLVIGNFAPDPSMASRKEPDGLDYGYYLVDDVLVKALDASPVQEFIVNETLTLENILFEFDRAILKPSSREPLDELVQYLQHNRELNLEVIGHTDAIGSTEYNLELSRDRANAIQAYLVEQGIKSSRITPVGLGNSVPLVHNDTEENRQLNRRVEIRITQQKNTDPNSGSMHRP